MSDPDVANSKDDSNCKYSLIELFAKHFVPDFENAFVRQPGITVPVY